MLFISGKDDPVGNYGRGVKQVVRKLKRNKVSNINLIIYKNDRHEILNETDKKAVLSDTLTWMNKIISPKKY